MSESTDLPERISVMYVDDEENNLISFKAAFRRDFQVYTALSAAEALETLRKETIHVLITDQRMPQTLGTELLAQVVEEQPDQIRILLTGFSDIDALQDAVNRGQIFRYLQKPWKDDDLRETILAGARVYFLKKKQRELTEQLKLTNEQLEFVLRQKLLS
jgi:response regulator RpfG family c-di-GMP phosphodiesterase